VVYSSGMGVCRILERRSKLEAIMIITGTDFA
jgi:hypothetical protein